jgi:hypothetical protein
MEGLSARQLILEGILAARCQTARFLHYNFNDLPNNIAAVAAGTLFEQILNRCADCRLGSSVPSKISEMATPHLLPEHDLREAYGYQATAIINRNFRLTYDGIHMAVVWRPLA